MAAAVLVAGGLPTISGVVKLRAGCDKHSVATKLVLLNAGKALWRARFQIMV